jgi:hypothetical protein
MIVNRVTNPQWPTLGKVTGWFYRYAPSEALGTACALAGAGLVAQVSDSSVAVAMGGAWGEMVGFYLPLLIREYKATRRQGPLPFVLWSILRNLLLEFGVAEVLDTSLLRPGLMTLALQFITPGPLAIIVGKLAADLFFYGLAIGGYELRQKVEKLFS